VAKSQKTNSKAANAKAKAAQLRLPTREALLDYIARNPNNTSKREISRAFQITGDDRIYLKKLLRGLKDEGILQKSGKRFQEQGGLPSVAPLDITSRDRDGGLIAQPIEWDESHGEMPIISVRVDKKAKSHTPGVGDRILARIAKLTLPKSKSGKTYYSARPIKTLSKRQDATLGILRIDDQGNGHVEPIQRRQRELMVENNDFKDAKNGDLIEVQETRGKRYGLNLARIIKALGSMESEKAISAIAIHEYEIPHIFPQTLLDEAERAQSPTPQSDSKREDWRDLPLTTIDPRDAKDHDDAIFAEFDEDEDNQGGVILYVAIADVSYFVTANSALDKEAQKRGNSTYFPDQVVPMLPEKISNDLCSLREGEIRPALMAKMTFDKSGYKKHHSFHRVFMKNHIRLSYEEAQEAFDGNPNERAKPHMEQILTPLYAAYKILKKGRDAREPLELEVPERKIILDENGRVKSVIVPERLDAHKLVEECMIQANVAAAETLEQKRHTLIYRTHNGPSLDKLEILRTFLSSIDLKIGQSSTILPSLFNQILESQADSAHFELLNQVVLRAQSQAEYSPLNTGHFGLHLKRYAHFTSPIRRYADLVIHRALIDALNIGQEPTMDFEPANLEQIATQISQSERRSMAAERDTKDRLIAHYLSDKVGAEFNARINGVVGAGIFVTLSETGADGFIPVRQLGDEYFIFDDARHAMIGEQSSQGFQIGDRVLVRLMDVSPVSGSLEFEMLSEGKKFKTLPRSRPIKARAKRNGSFKRSGKDNSKAYTKRKKPAQGRRKR
jgi:ribonuclease R